MSVQPSDYQKALDAAHAEIQEILRQKATLDLRLTQLKKTIDALNALVQEAPTLEDNWISAVAGMLGDVGISNAIRCVLLESPVPMTPVEIRDALEVHGVALGHYANPLSVIHNTLKRLTDQGDLQAIPDGFGQIRTYSLHPVVADKMRRDASQQLIDARQSDFPHDHPVAVAQRRDREKSKVPPNFVPLNTPAESILKRKK
ncbi:MAG TPA: hypothetical protein VEG68_07050 [Terriglobales bacterium]|nr:hypothetical protein [Terriglobales bacterium]